MEICQKSEIKMNLTKLPFFQIFLIALLASAVSSASFNFDDLQKKFKADETSVYSKEKVIGAELEPTVKEIYREFLKSAPLVQKDRIESYFRDWKLVEDIDGPFENAYKQEKALKAVMKPSDFHASLFVEQLLENRDDSKELIAVFQDTMISPDTVKLRLYFSGDGDIINSIIIASLKNSGDLYVITSIYD